MNEQVNQINTEAKNKMTDTIEHLERELAKIRAGQANPRMLDGILVDMYGTMSPLNQVSSLSTPDPRSIAIQPWDKNLIPVIEKAIMAANLGMNPENNGEIIRINIPPLTEERRKDLVKIVRKESEESRISIRNARRDAMEELKKLLKDGLAEDAEKKAADKVQKITDDYMKQIDEMLKEKEEDIMTV